MWEHHLSRRRLLGLLAGTGFASVCFPRSLGALDVFEPLAVNFQTQRRVIFLELDGGNDGLNTVIPVSDDRYYQWRSARGLAIPASAALSLDGWTDHRLHPALAHIRQLYNQGECAIVHGVGYADMNRSHFRGIDIWNTGSSANEFLQDGWMGRYLHNNPWPQAIAEGVLLERSGSNPAEHAGLRLLAMADPEQFIADGVELRQVSSGDLQAVAGIQGLEHVMDIHNQVRQAAYDLGGLLGGINGVAYAPPTFSTEFPDTDLGRQLRSVAQMIVSGAAIPIYKVSLSGFDTHAGQVDRNDPTGGRHRPLLVEVDTAIHAFRNALHEYQRWDDCLLLTYAEFGRRVEPNASLGTDHGAANVHFMWGGAIQGGMYGASPSLAEADLERGDPAATVDFRSYFSTATQFLGGVDPSIFSAGPFDPLPII